jgi:ribosomal protein S18 acetylase RimI-like enzyme
MKILKGNEKHIDECLSIAKELRQYFNEKGISAMGKNLENQSLYVAMDVDEVVGFVTIQHKNNHVAEISWMAVKLKYQNQGIGSALVDHIATDLRHRGIRLLEIKTLSKDVEYPPYELTRRFYEKVGFIHIDTIDPYPEWEHGNPYAIYIKIL